MEDYLGFLLGLALVKTILIIGGYGFYRDGKNWIRERKIGKIITQSQKELVEVFRNYLTNSF